MSRDDVIGLVCGSALLVFFAFSIWLLWYNASNKDL